MNDTQLETLNQIRQFLEGTEAVSFQIESKDARYRWLQKTKGQVLYCAFLVFLSYTNLFDLV